MRKNVAVFVTICVAVGMGFSTLSEIFYVNVTSSLPQGIYMRVPRQELQVGDYIVYEPSRKVKKTIIKNGWGNGKHDFLKQIGAVSGEKYSVDGETLEFKIEGKFFGRVYERDNEGKELPKMRGNFEVAEGYVLPVASEARSFDGRYSGAIPISRIKAKVTPLLIWQE